MRAAPPVAPAVVDAVVPDSLPDAVLRTPVWEARPGEVLFRLPGVGRFLVRAGEPPRVERAPGATDADVRCFVEGPIAAAAAVMRGLVPLRAATVAIRGRAVAIAGPSVAGKSSLAAALALRGHAVLADAVTVASPEGGVHVVRPLGPDAVLWPDVARLLGLDPDAGRVVRPALAKRAFRLGPRPAPAPLAAIVLLGRNALLSEPEVESVLGTAKPAPVLGAGWCLNLVEALGVGTARFRSLAGLVEASACYRLTRPREGTTPGELARVVEELVS